VLVFLVAIAVACFAATAVNDAVEPAGTLADVLGVVDAQDEGNLVTWLSAAILAAGGLLCGRVGLAERRSATAGWLGWVLLGVLLVAFGVDEVAQLHERTAGPAVDLVEDVTGQGGTVARLLVAALAAAVGAAVLAVAVPWLRQRARRTRRLLLLAGALYFCGAFGLEILARLLETANIENVVADVLPSFEELAEMTGSALLVYLAWIHR
jgi:hypothetical protein